MRLDRLSKKLCPRESCEMKREYLKKGKDVHKANVNFLVSTKDSYGNKILKCSKCRFFIYKEDLEVMLLNYEEEQYGSQNENNNLKRLNEI